MTLYTYFIEDSELKRKVKETFPEFDIIDKGISVNRNISTIKKGALKALQGEVQRFYIELEEKWFASITGIQDALNEFKNLDSKKKYLEGKLETLYEKEPYKNIVILDTKDKIKKTKSDISDLTKKYNILIKNRDDLEQKHEYLKGFRAPRTPKGLKCDIPKPEMPEINGIEDLTPELKEKLISYEIISEISLEKLVMDLYSMDNALIDFLMSMFNALPADVQEKISKPSNIDDILKTQKRILDLKSEYK